MLLLTPPGNPLRIFLTAGNVNDTMPAGELFADLSGDKLLADRAYDRNAVLKQAGQQIMEVVTPSRKRRRHPRTHDFHVYKERHLVECFFCKDQVILLYCNTL